MPVWSVARRGFSLLELLVVLVVIGLLFGIAVPKGSAVRNLILVDQAAQQLVGDLRLTQTEAIRRNRSLAFTRTSASAYTIDSVGVRSLPSGVSFTASVSPIRFRSMGPPSAATTFTVTIAGLSRSVIVSATGLISVQ